MEEKTPRNCECGCGGITNLATSSHAARGYMKGQPVRFLPGHSLKINRTKIIDGTKVCSRCGHAKPIEDFYKRSDRPIGIDSACKECDLLFRGYRRDLDLIPLRGLSRACAICGTTENIVVDHDHITGKTRGYLCRSHNLGLGNFQDNLEFLAQAIEYLRNR